MQRLSFLICILGISCAVHAQSNAGSWSNLSALREGEKIQVSEISKTKVVGEFASFTDSTITVQTKAGSRNIERAEVRSVKRMKVKHRWVHSLLLGGAGAGIGYGIGRSQYHPCPKDQSFYLDIAGDVTGSVGLVAGFLGGAAVGAALPIHETVYNAAEVHR